MIHVLTVHWRNEDWIEPQLNHLSRHIDRPYRVYAFLNGIDPAAYKDKFFYICTEDIKSHAIKLNLLADIACLAAEGPDDWLIFLDSDAFPIADVVGYAEDRLHKYPLIAVRRDENLGDPQPHPCFCITTVGFWKKIGGDWKRGYQWKNAAGNLVTDVGGNLLGKLREKNIGWLPMLRSNQINLHPVFFGIYDNLVYHHGAGSRKPVIRVDKAKFRRLPWALRKLLTTLRVYKFGRSKALQENVALSERILQEINSNPEFYLQFTQSSPE
jgi:hypothetical protein